ncbi:hypothetical protein McanMca71_002472 [Microsporum canis]|uniref:Uncharacterized protein n=1 Tax=Arthroderma otae (strain ATCC MYA-4605 / CBS 113480) TaxID=554155 RepID=C5FYF7_ARTOC|nr:uncharacterized protein MCYG_07374 [Microsporum canis CBS 113480]EEQ34555.1 predicted protein [Microsporum canis CBS 113480]
MLSWLVKVPEDHESLEMVFLEAGYYPSVMASKWSTREQADLDVETEGMKPSAKILLSPTIEIPVRLGLRFHHPDALDSNVGKGNKARIANIRTGYVGFERSEAPMPGLILVKPYGFMSVSPLEAIWIGPRVDPET